MRPKWVDWERGSSGLEAVACSKVGRETSAPGWVRTVLLKNPDNDRIWAEARATYYEYGRTRQRFRSDRSDAELRGRLERLRDRYTELEQALGVTPEMADFAGREAVLSVPDLRAASLLSSPSYCRYPRVERSGLAAGFLSTAGRVRLLISILCLLAAGGVLLLIGNQNLGFYRVPSSSMEPTLQPDDHLLAYTASRYDRGEVVVVRDPDAADGYLVKRLVGLPGDVVSVREGSLIVNGVRIAEPYVKEPITYKLVPVTIRAGEVFLLGDNRNQSHDGHIWKRGVSATTIMGAVRHIYSPRSRIGTQVTFRDAFTAVEDSPLARSAAREDASAL